MAEGAVFDAQAVTDAVAEGIAKIENASTMEELKAIKTQYAGAESAMTQASKAIGMEDAAAWRALMARVPTYLDEDGLANYFPPRAGETRRGSDTLTAFQIDARRNHANQFVKHSHNIRAVGLQVLDHPHARQHLLAPLFQLMNIFDLCIQG